MYHFVWADQKAKQGYNWNVSLERGIHWNVFPESDPKVLLFQPTMQCHCYLLGFIYKVLPEYRMEGPLMPMLQILNVSLCVGGSKGQAGIQLKCILGKRDTLKCIPGKWSKGAVIPTHNAMSLLFARFHIQSVTWIPYGGKPWRGETLANLANDHGFAKFIPTKFYPVKENHTW